ncbi:MAG TPA: hypothetical protein VK862_13270 [Afifellaceae bacterium]|nr:hypothetical protein [Afifellaceae bacterium]
MEIPRPAILAISKTGLGTKTTLSFVAVLKSTQMAMRSSRFQSRFISMPVVAISRAGNQAKTGTRKLMSIPPMEKTGGIDAQFDLPASPPLPVQLPFVSPLSGPETRLHAVLSGAALQSRSKFDRVLTCLFYISFLKYYGFIILFKED